MKKILILTSILYFFALNLFAQSTFVIEGKSKFSEFELKNLNMGRGKAGREIILLKENEYSVSPDTDLLMHFNDISFTDESGNYIVQEHYNNISGVKNKFGNSSAYFFKNRGMSISAIDESMFTNSRVLGDFSIDFWIYPTTISQDTTLFLWKGVNKVDNRFVKQIIKGYFEDRHVVWTFENLFTPEDFNDYTIELKGKTRLIPDKWSHHLIRYNSETGMIEYLMDGVPEDIKFTTPTFEETSEIYSPYIGNFSKSEFFIGQRFSGFIDELRISEKFIENLNLEKYKNHGFYKSPVYDINKTNILFTNIESFSDIDPETTIKHYYRISDKPFLINNDAIKWLELDDNLINKKGRYIQLSADFYSSGNSNKTPVLNKIEIRWDTIPSPPAPLVVEAEAKVNAVEVNWSPIKHYNVSGYYIYIGNKSNNYQEVIDVGNKSTYTINNLKSNQIYYISVKSYNNDNESEFSKEIYIRPK